MVQLASAMDTVNDFIDSRGVLGALLVAAITTGVGLWWRRNRPIRELTWSTLYDGPVNQATGPLPDPTPPLWHVSLVGDPNPLTDPSLVLLRVQNSGTEALREGFFRPHLSFTFAGREVMGAKVRDNEEMHDHVQRKGGLEPGPDGRRLELPAFDLNAGDTFTVLVLLQGPATPDARVEAHGQIVGGRIEQQPARRPPYRLLAVGTALAVLIAGVTLGVRLANDALTPSASCASGQLTLQGSSAFAPVANQVRNSYRQLCGNGATIDITADGSDRGLGDLERSRGSGTIAMSDGLPASALAAEGLTRRPVGVVSFAVVANTGLRATLPDLFTSNGISADELRSLFSGNGGALATSLVAVGRTHASGTRSAFAGAFFGGTDPEPQTAPACAPAISSGFCVSDNTMDLLSFVNSHPNAIGYAEADALPYFPDVQVVAVDAQTPSEQSVISGAYPFVATEYLYTADRPAGLVADFLDFLTSPAEIVALRGHGFIACANLHGTKLGGACDG